MTTTSPPAPEPSPAPPAAAAPPPPSAAAAPPATPPPAGGAAPPPPGGTPSPPAKDAEPKPTWKAEKQSWVAVAIFVIVVIAGVLAILAAWRLPPFNSNDERTDNAYVHGRTTIISPQVSGYVAQVTVEDFQRVQKGQVLAYIDQRSYRQAVDSSQASLDSSRAALANNQQTIAIDLAAVEVAEAAIESARAGLINSRNNLARSTDLARDGSLSRKERDSDLSTYREGVASVDQAIANRDSAIEQVKSDQVNGGALRANVEGALANLRTAQLNLSNTIIRAPEAGQLSNIGVRTGQYVTNGTQLLYLVPADLWVTANYKEEQTRHMYPGQPAWFTVDALGKARIRGRLERISPAAGAEFAVIKPDNATGNFTKAPQRIPMRITILPDQREAARLRAGMSVEVHVDTSSGRDRNGRR